MPSFFCRTLPLRSSRSSATLLMVALAAAATSVSAHTGLHASDLQDHHALASTATQTGAWLAGLWHTFSGWDHWAAAFLVGLWSSMTLPRRQVWLGPLTFCGVVAAGTWAALHFGVHSTLNAWVEPMILASVAVLVLMVLLRVRLGLPVMALGLATFGLWHGLAHGLELSQITYAGSIAGGVLCGTAIMHLIGALLGQSLHRQHGSVRAPR
jgi:urease accessory protein